MDKSEDKSTGLWNGLLKFLELLVTVVAISALPWGVYVTSNLHELDIRTTKIESWMAQGPRFTQNDAESLRLRILTESKVQMDASMKPILDKLDAVESAIVGLKVELAKRP